MHDRNNFDTLIADAVDDPIGKAQDSAFPDVAFIEYTLALPAPHQREVQGRERGPKDFIDVNQLADGRAPLDLFLKEMLRLQKLLRLLQNYSRLSHGHDNHAITVDNHDIPGRDRHPSARTTGSKH